MIRYLYFIPIICILSFFTVLLAQNHDDLYILYNNKKFKRLETRLSELEKRHLNDPEIVFFKTIFKDDGEVALKIYQDLYKTSGGPLKNLLAKKMSEYYFAQGYYVKAQEYRRASNQKFKVKPKDNSRTADNRDVQKKGSSKQLKYIIQVGAFGVEKNADDLADVLRRKKVNVSVVERNINNKILYCVWVQGDEDYSATKDIAETIKSKYKLTYRILKP